MRGEGSVGPGRKEVDFGYFEEFKADIGTMLDGQRAELRAAMAEELRAVTAELRSDIQLVLQKLGDEREEDSESDDAPAVDAEGDPGVTELEKPLPAAGATLAPQAAVFTSPHTAAAPASSERPQVEPGAAAGGQPDEPDEDLRAQCPHSKTWKSMLLGDFAWEWQHQDGRWELYLPRTCRRIEEAFWSGETMVHIKSSNDKVMEIYFVDMLQLEPASERIRPVRRLGAREFPFGKYPWMWIRRYTGRLAQEVATGKPQLESLKEYKRRERAELSTTGLRMEKDDGDNVTFHGVNLDWDKLFKQERNKLFKVLTDSFPFIAASIFVTCLQAAYMGATFSSVKSARLSLWERGIASISIEYFFCLFFLVELIMRINALSRISEGLRDAWFCFDLVCVVLSVLDVIVLSPLQHLGLVEFSTTSSQAFRILRVGRVFRFIRLVRQFKGLTVVLRGFVLGMRSVVYILVLMSILVFAFSCFIQSNIYSDDFKNKRFGSLGKSMQTLIFSGILLDGVKDLGTDFVDHNEIGAMMVFWIFLLISYFGLLNMLIGSFCNTAMQVSQQEGHEAQIGHLAMNLRSLLECYLTEGTETMDRQQFQLIMKNMHVHNILRTCGTDMDALMMLEDIMFPTEHSQLHFNKFFGVVTRLRADAPACVSHMVCIMAAIENLCANIKQDLSLSKPQSDLVVRTAATTGSRSRGLSRSYGLHRRERKIPI